MKNVFVALVFVFLSTQVDVAIAHGDHGSISESSAVYIANNAVKKMTFKDMGFQVGKLEESWKSIPAEDVKVIEVGEGFYLISARNQESKKEIFLKIDETGQVLDVYGNNPF